MMKIKDMVMKNDGMKFKILSRFMANAKQLMKNY